MDYSVWIADQYRHTHIVEITLRGTITKRRYESCECGALRIRDHAGVVLKPWTGGLQRP